jgi:DNA-binding IclR family transcriptional regulator
MEDNASKPKTVAASKRCFTILEALLEHEGGARISELSEELEMAKSSIHSHLATLRELEYIAKEGDLYNPGLQFIKIGEQVRNRNHIFQASKPYVKEIAATTDEVASLMAEEHGWGVFVHRRKGANVARQATPGERYYLHATAGGKAILAHLPEKRVEDIIESQGLPSLTGRTITNQDDLFSELQEIRDTGVAFNDQEDVHGLRAVGVPVNNQNGNVVGALTVHGPAHRMEGSLFEEEIPDLLLNKADDIQLNVAFDQ